jgi:hypothetical protein
MIPGYGGSLVTKLRKLPAIYVDYSFAPVLALALWLAWRRFQARSWNFNSPLAFGLAACLFVPLALDLVGVFPLYYFWMAFVPLAVGVCAELSRASTTRPSSISLLGACALLTLACLVGLPKRMAVAALDWRGRDYRPVMELAAPYVARDKLVLADFSAYYAAKQSGAQVILPSYLPVITEQDKSRLNVAIIRNGDSASLAHDFGGHWRDTGAALQPPLQKNLLKLRESLDSRQYDLHVYVRE